MLLGIDPNIDLRDYDNKDEFDLDGDGDLKEPDGIIDHLIVNIQLHGMVE